MYTHDITLSGLIVIKPNKYISKIFVGFDYHFFNFVYLIIAFNLWIEHVFFSCSRVNLVLQHKHKLNANNNTKKYLHNMFYFIIPLAKIASYYW